MSDYDVTSLMSALEPPTGVRLRQATVVSNSGTTSTITLAGGSTQLTGIARMSHVYPLPGSAVWVAVDGRDMMIIGTLSSVPVPHVRVARSTSQSIALATFTNVVFNTVQGVDTWGMWNGTNPERMNAPLDGIYMATANTQIAAPGGAEVAYGVLVHTRAGTTQYVDYSFTGATGYNLNVNVTGVYPMLAGDYVLSQVWLGGSASTISAGLAFASLTYLGPKP